MYARAANLPSASNFVTKLHPLLPVTGDLFHYPCRWDSNHANWHTFWVGRTTPRFPLVRGIYALTAKGCELKEVLRKLVVKDSTALQFTCPWYGKWYLSTHIDGIGCEGEKEGATAPC